MAYAPVPETVVATETVAATGMLPMLLLASAVLTAPVSLFLLALYRRAVLRVMASQSGTAAPRVQTNVPASAPLQRLQVRLVDGRAIDAAATPQYDRALHSLGTATLIYVLAGVAYAVVLTSPWLLFPGEEGIPLARILWLMSCYLWPTALAAGMLIAVSRGQRALVGIAYLGMLFAVALYGVFARSQVTVGELATFWLLTNAPATLLLLAFLHRRVRAVGPLVLAFMVTAVTGSQLLVNLAGRDESGAMGASLALLVLGLAVFGAAGWWLLKRLGRRYEERRMSDQSLTLDAMWLLFGVVQSITFPSQSLLWVFTGLLGFAVYKLAARAGFAMAGFARKDAASPMMLLLRVFALGGKSERLFDALSKRWLRAGSIAVIAGPDLAATTVEPHEFLDYMAGRLPQRFVRGTEDLERRVRSVERGPDPDGRYRVNEFFCYADTWQPTMAKLAAGADVVLMDLRSFSPSNQGCIFELQQLLDSVALDRVVFLIDDTTDTTFLGTALQEAWQRVAPASPNRTVTTAEARLVRLAKDDAADVRGAVKLLLGGSSVERQTPNFLFASSRLRDSKRDDAGIQPISYSASICIHVRACGVM